MSPQIEGELKKEFWSLAQQQRQKNKKKMCRFILFQCIL